MISSPFRARDDGSIEVRLTDVEVQVLRAAVADLAESLDAEDAAFRRLFPPAYDDDRQQTEYAALTRDDLLEGRIDAARTVLASLEAGALKRGRWLGVLDIGTAEAWLGVFNDLRLVLGTRLDVSEDMDHTPLPGSDPRAPAFNLYLYLGGVQELLIEAMAG